MNLYTHTVCSYTHIYCIIVHVPIMDLVNICLYLVLLLELKHVLDWVASCFAVSCNTL